MFVFKQKLENNLKLMIEDHIFKTYRVNITYRAFTKTLERKLTSQSNVLLHHLLEINTVSAIVSEKTIEYLLEYPEVKYIYLDSFAFLCGKPTLSSNTVCRALKASLTGKNIGIALIDSGIYPHADLIKPFNKIKYFTDLLGKIRYPYDDNGHGTVIGGIICGSGYSSKGNIKGVAPDSHIYAIKAFNKLGRGYISDIFYGMECILNDYKDFNIKIACLPMELMEHNITVIKDFSHYFDLFISKGIVPVVASGSQENIPCSIKGISTLSNCITAGDSEYKYSSCGPVKKRDKPDINCRCTGFSSLNSDPDYISEKNSIRMFPHILKKPYSTYTGSSCSAAYICGICALILENKPDISFNDLLALLNHL